MDRTGLIEAGYRSDRTPSSTIGNATLGYEYDEKQSQRSLKNGGNYFLLFSSASNAEKLQLLSRNDAPQVARNVCVGLQKHFSLSKPNFFEFTTFTFRLCRILRLCL